jgi:hypothetical protein
MQYPHILSCYLLVERNGKPPMPDEKAIESHVIHSKEQSDRLKRELKERHPGSWIVELPIG